MWNKALILGVLTLGIQVSPVFAGPMAAAPAPVPSYADLCDDRLRSQFAMMLGVPSVSVSLCVSLLGSYLTPTSPPPAPSPTPNPNVVPSGPVINQQSGDI